MPTLDVLIPYYNKKNYIEKAIDSIMACPNYDKYLNKIIIVNDKSDTEHTEILYNIQERNSYVKVFNRKKSKGLFATRLDAFKLSSADYVVSLDADSVFYKDAFNIFNDFIEQGLETVLVYEMISMYNGILVDDRRTDYIDQWSFEDMIEEKLHFENSMNVKLLPKKIKDKLIEFLDGCYIPSDIKLDFMEDVLFTGVLISVNPTFAVVDRIACICNKNCDNIMNGVRDVSPFEIYYKYIKPTNKLSHYSIKYLDYQLRRAKGD